MKVEVDLSGRIENTKTKTVIAYSNGERRVLIISAVEKRKLIRLFRELKISPKFFYLEIFCALVFLLFKKYFFEISAIVFDQEYIGLENEVKLRLIKMAKKHGVKFDKEKISFKRVGKKSPAHILAIDIFRKNKEIDEELGRKVTAREIFRLIFP